MNARCGVRTLIWVLCAFPAVGSLWGRDGDISFTVRVRRPGATLRTGPSYAPIKDWGVEVGELFVVEDYVAPHFRVSPMEHEDEDYYLRAVDVEPADSRPATVRSKTPLFRSMAVKREIISYLEKGTRLDVLGGVPDLKACLVRTKANVFGWISCAALNLTYERKGCYRLADDLDSIEITIQPGTTLSTLAAETGEPLESVRKECKADGDTLFAGGKCRFELPLLPPRLYTVQKADTLTSISENMSSLSITSLQRWNCLPNTTLRPGQRLLVLVVH